MNDKKKMEIVAQNRRIRRNLILRTPTYSQLKLELQKCIKSFKKTDTTRNPEEGKRLTDRLNTLLPQLNKVRRRFEPINDYVSVMPGKLSGKETRPIDSDLLSSITAEYGPIDIDDILLFQKEIDIESLIMEISLIDIEYPYVKDIILRRIDRILKIFQIMRGPQKKRIRNDMEKLHAWDLRKKGYDTLEIGIHLFPERFPENYKEMNEEERKKALEKLTQKEHDLFLDDLPNIKRIVERYIQDIDRKIAKYDKIIKKIVHDT